jgi:hypothetical protein
MEQPNATAFSAEHHVDLISFLPLLEPGTISLAQSISYYIVPCWTESFRIWDWETNAKLGNFFQSNLPYFSLATGKNLPLFSLSGGHIGSQDSSVSVVTSPWARRPTNIGSSPDSDKEIHLFCPEPRPALGPTQPPSQWLREVFLPRRKAAGSRGVNLTNYLHLVPSLGKCGAMTPHPHVFMARIGTIHFRCITW